MPIYTSGGAPVLQRIISPDNLKTLHDSSRPMKDRLLEVGQLMSATGKLYNLYMDAARNGKVVHVEVGQLIVVILREYATQADLMYQFIATSDQPFDDPRRAPILKQTNDQYAMAYGGIIDGLADNKFLSMGDNSLVLAAAADSFPSVNRFLDADSRAALVQKLEALRKHLTFAMDLRNIDRMTRAAGAAPAKP